MPKHCIKSDDNYFYTPLSSKEIIIVQKMIKHNKMKTGTVLCDTILKMPKLNVLEDMDLQLISSHEFEYVCQKIANLVVDFWNLGYFHLDLHAGNILFDSDRFYLIDFETCKEIKNVGQFYCSIYINLDLNITYKDTEINLSPWISAEYINYVRRTASPLRITETEKQVRSRLRNIRELAKNKVTEQRLLAFKKLMMMK